MRTKKGFTLIELLVVIAIIGLLSSVVLASLNSARRSGRDARRISDIGQLRMALEMHFDANGGYPANLGALDTDFMTSQPMDPTTGNAYFYEAAGSAPHTSYCLGAALEDTDHPSIPDTLPCTVTGANYTVQP